MSKQPLVSVVMNCFNSDKYLKEAIESVVQQTYQNWEIIFWDNQSKDTSAQIVKSYDDKRIKYFYAPQHTLLGEARNLAIEKCTGEWIGFLDCDDIWDENKLTKYFIEFFKSKNIQNISLIYARSNFIDSNGYITSKSLKSISGNIHDELLITGNFIVFSSILIRKDILNKNGNVNQSLNYCEDYDLLLKICKNNLAIGIDEYLTSYRIHIDNITTKKRYLNDLETFEFLKKYINENQVKLNIKKHVFFNNSYRITVLLIKQLINKEYKNVWTLISKYFVYITFSPISIIYIKLGIR